ncbi:hypothetical protein [Halorussus sp. MSC15.2]|uniref:hypothetical protein n=1 Tax=Halorussus sp. MSC15.2 TaxID=2283638 RepID=UPI0013CF5B99|nr:hypothetical protein [Halorussus sp. MSC15.2]NEU57802.1 hypothetical protein [Halorussus sp. MSC15.2]
MTDTTRRSFVAATGAIIAGSLAGCTSVTSSGGGPDETTVDTTDVSQTATTDDEPSSDATTTGDGGDSRTTRSGAHPGKLSILNDTDERKSFVVTIMNENTGDRRTLDVTVSAGKQHEIPDAYPIVEEGTVVHRTTIESDGKLVGERDVRVFDYHKVHDVTATVTESGVEWTTVVH